MPTNKDKRPRVYLNSVHLKGFKSIEDLTTNFQKGLNILIGRNGAGKSNFMEFIDLTFLYRTYSKILYRYAKLEYTSSDNHIFMIETERELHPRAENELPSDRVRLSERFFIDGDVVFDNSIDKDSRKVFEFQNRKIPFNGLSRLLFMRLGYQNISPFYIKYDLPDSLGCIDSPGVLKANIEDQYFLWTFPDTLHFIDGILWGLGDFYEDESVNKIENITVADIFQHLKLQDGIIDNLKLYTTIEDVRFNSNISLYKEENSLIIENVRLEFKLNGNWLPWSQLSDGTRRLFYIISEVTYSNGLILIEEPELGVHPHQFNLLMDFLKEQSKEKQIIISTHSPKALDHLSPEELDHILIAYYDLDKGTQIRHLSDKEIKKAQKYMKEVGFFSDYWLHSDLEE